MSKLLIHHNRKWLGWVLALTLVVMASASNASWQCPDGTLCHDHASCQNKVEKVSLPQASPSPHCSHCQTGVAPSLIKGSCLACPQPQCVLNIRNAPNVKQVEKFHIAAPDILHAQTLAFDAPIFAGVALCLTKQEFHFSPCRFLRPCLGRAPPA